MASYPIICWWYISRRQQLRVSRENVSCLIDISDNLQNGLEVMMFHIWSRVHARFTRRNDSIAWVAGYVPTFQGRLMIHEWIVIRSCEREHESNSGLSPICLSALWCKGIALMMTLVDLHRSRFQTTCPCSRTLRTAVECLGYEHVATPMVVPAISQLNLYPFLEGYLIEKEPHEIGIFEFLSFFFNLQWLSLNAFGIFRNF